MSYPALAKILKVRAKKAGITKRITLYKFQHGRTTFLAGKLTENKMNQIFGRKNVHLTKNYTLMHTVIKIEVFLESLKHRLETLGLKNKLDLPRIYEPW